MRKFVIKFGQLFECILETFGSLLYESANDGDVRKTSALKTGRTRRKVIRLKSPISLKFGTNVGPDELIVIAQLWAHS